MRPPTPLALRPLLVSAGGREEAGTSARALTYWSHDARNLHDAFNFATLPLAVLLVCIAVTPVWRSTFWQRRLAWFLLCYMIVDGGWIAVQPSIVGSPGVLLSHHGVTILLLAHALRHSAHLHYVAWMSVVEANTLLLVLKRHLRHWCIEAAFFASWLLIRVVWFPYVAFHMCFVERNWPSRATHAVVASCTSALALLQLMWTQKALGPLIRRALGVHPQASQPPPKRRNAGFL
jgi:hypothetical protein